jgi:hypothetical protein
MKANGYVTFRMSEKTTDNGFQWKTPLSSLVFNCLVFENENYGDFVTGY